MKPAATAFVTERPLRPEEMHDLASSPEHGALSLFIGVVRERHEGRAVAAMTYDAFAPLAEKELARIAEEACARWSARVAVGHRIGRLEVGESSVVIAAGCAHRAEAFDACRFVIEQIKARLPVWKKEHGVDGSVRWLEGCALHPGNKA
jgi:molybdopterin synthase catalytic subunit